MIKLTPLEKDTIAEVGNISLGASATALSVIIDKLVEITTPRLEILSVAEVKKRFPAPCIAAEVNYTAGLQGSNIFLIKEKDARVIATLMMGAPVEDIEKPLDEFELSAIQEAMNQMMGLMATSMSEMFNRRIVISPPLVERRNLAVAEPVLRGLADCDQVVELAFKMRVEALIDSALVQLIPLESARAMAAFLLGEESAYTQQNATATAAGLPPREKEDSSDLPGCGAAAAPVRKAPQVLEADPRLGGYSAPPGAAKAGHPGEEAIFEKLELVKDLSVDVTAILSSTRLPLGVLFDLEKGALIDLGSHIDQPVELLVNGKLMAYGEVVLVNEQLGVRINKMHLDLTQG